MKEAFTARAKTVLVFGGRTNPKAVLTELLVTATERTRQRYRFSGPVSFDEKLRRHAGNVLIPLVDEICSYLGISPQRFEISAVNLGAASGMERGASISQFSADLPLFLAMLAAACCIDLPKEVVTTGHIASRDGHIRFVRHVPEKLEAARSDPEVRLFAFPALGCDQSLRALLPNEVEEVDGDVRKNRDQVGILPVARVEQLIEAVFPADALVKAALRAGFFDADVVGYDSQSSALKVARHFTRDSEERFLAVLERGMLGDGLDGARDLLSLRIRFNEKRRHYPRGLGHRLRLLVASLPPSVRRLLVLEPLLPMNQALILGRIAGEKDLEDAQDLFALAWGRLPVLSPRGGKQGELPDDQSDALWLQCLLDDISRENLAQRIGNRIDSARGAYVLESSIVASKEDFDAVVIGFYIHLLRYMGSVSGKVDAEDLAPMAIELLEQAYAREGGYVGALTESLAGTSGGLRTVLDRMTEEFKAEKQQNYILFALKTAFDPTDFDAAVQFVRAFMDRYGRDLPEEIRCQPAERWARKHEEIIRAYVQARDGLVRMMQTL